MIIIQGDDAVLQLSIQTYERAESEIPEDNNWLRAEIAAKIAGFSSSVTLAITTIELNEFLNQLRRILAVSRGVARLETSEKQLWIEIDLKTTGTALVAIRIVDPGFPRCKLECQFSTDQTYLQTTSKNLEKMMAAYPIRS